MKDNELRLFLVYSLNICFDNPLNISSGKPLFFSNKKKAEEVISRFKDHYPFLYGDSSHEERVYCLILEEFELNSPYRYQLSTSVFSPEGQLLTESLVPDDGPFLGRPEKAMCHEVGEVVELPFGNQLVFGIVVEKPMCFNEDAGLYGLTASDDCYTILHHQSHELNYAHSPMVFKPSRDVPEAVRKDLTFAFEKCKEQRKEN